MTNSKKYSLLLTFALLVATLTASVTITAPVAAQGSSDWPMYRYDAANTGYNPYSSGPSPINVKWVYRTGDSIRSSAAIVAGKVYVGSNDGNLYCLDSESGAFLWKFTTGNAVRSSPAVVGGKVYFGSYDNYVYCIDANQGSLVWKYQTGFMVPGSPNVVDGRVYIISDDKHLYCLDALTGAQVWNFTTRGSQLRGYEGNVEPRYENCKPAVALGRVFFTYYDNYNYCLDQATGTMLWENTEPTYIGTYSGESTFRGRENSPAVDVANQAVYIATRAEYWTKFNATTGEIIWAKRYNEALQVAAPNNNILQNSAVLAYGKVYYQYSGPHMACQIDPETGLIMNMGMMGILCRSSLVAAGGKLYCGNNDRYMYVWSGTDMARLQSFDVPQILEATPSVANDKVYIGCANGEFYCFEEGTPQTLNLLSIDPTPRSVSLGKTMVISGAIAPYHLNGPEGQTVTIHFVRPDGTLTTATVGTGAAGIFSANYVPDMVGDWKTKATWDGNPWWAPSESYYQTFAVTAAQAPTSTTISTSVSPATITPGNSVTVSGTISPIVDASIVTLTYTKPDGTSVTRTSLSGAGGAYTDTYKPDAEGSWSVKASWAGNNAYTGATSSSAAFTVSAAEEQPTGGAAIPMEIIYAVVAIIIIAIVAVLGYWYMKRPKK